MGIHKMKIFLWIGPILRIQICKKKKFENFSLKKKFFDGQLW